VLIAKQVEHGLGTLIGDRNVVNIYFPRAEAGMHARVANIKFLNVPIYKKFVKKTRKLQRKYIKFNPHPKNLDFLTEPSEETLKELGF
jgi:hypothetical protein